MGDEDHFVPAVVSEDCMNFFHHHIARKCFMRYSEANRHDFESNDTNFSVFAIVGLLPDVMEDIGVWIESDANAMDEQHGMLSLGKMRAMPVRQMGHRRLVGR